MGNACRCHWSRRTLNSASRSVICNNRLPVTDLGSRDGAPPNGDVIPDGSPVLSPRGCAMAMLRRGCSWRTHAIAIASLW
ncbi:predicted protein [Chaetomium globosum CBS 148.51]|uniref:Uncharacterized protein n=1 Tax=Chaetomium globosum (strain ATCC 6205 / CBS 148.51 / DSM 1962 / NBRC 6347 / NRRL 1970) TaxID=306901 RepID=Q2H476_CHAGB|nr:uncharacterized protein CHGG_06539 [Chaetomium globosum CBS 148.51]EAQ89920.1 predicted protein [Chaetomium globosum CBS 148.51]